MSPYSCAACRSVALRELYSPVMRQLGAPTPRAAWRRRSCVDRTMGTSRWFSGRPRRRVYTKVVTGRRYFYSRHDNSDNSGEYPRIRDVTLSDLGAAQDFSNVSKDIAILGGGITGLSAAFYASKLMPKSRITLYEAGKRVGGWLNSEHVSLETGNVVLEQGPRTLRTNDAFPVLWKMITDLGLENELLVANSQTSPALKNRYIYYPDRMVLLPGGGQGLFEIGWKVLSEPLFSGMLSAPFVENAQPRRPPIADESIGSFLSRRFPQRTFVDHLFSSVLHGIYAGDIDKLSVRSLLPRLWMMEWEHGSLTAALQHHLKNKPAGGQWPVNPGRLIERDSLEATNRAWGLLAASNTTIPGWMRKHGNTISFKKGISILPETMAKKLAETQNVSIRAGTAVKSIEYQGSSKKVQIITVKKLPPKKYDVVISTIGAQKLSKLAFTSHQSPDMPALTALGDVHAVTVMVVNLFYENYNFDRYPGFGYLLPRTIPFSQNPEHALGVIFDSWAAAGQDTAQGSKLTVMLGGHYWDDYRASEIPDEEKGAAMAQAVIQRHLGIKATPTTVNVGVHRECIPQYNVGHRALLGEAAGMLREGFEGSLVLAGSSYHGVSVPDCAASGLSAVLTIGKGDKGGGLSKFEEAEQFLVLRGSHRE